VLLAAYWWKVNAKILEENRQDRNVNNQENNFTVFPFYIYICTCILKMACPASIIFYNYPGGGLIFFCVKTC
jgi:hypothetical protein